MTDDIRSDMKTEEIIEMAEKAGVAFSSDSYPDIWGVYMHLGKQEIEAFAKLVAAKEREKILAMSAKQWFKSQHDLEEAIRARGKA